MSENLSAFAYLFASVCFIMALRGLSSPLTARMGNIYGVIGMIVAVITTLAAPNVLSFTMILLGMLINALPPKHIFILQKVLRKFKNVNMEKLKYLQQMDQK